MSSLSIAVSSKTIWTTGDVRLWVSIDLWLRDAAGNFLLDSFRIDSATDVTTYPAYYARQRGLAIPLNPSPIRHNPTGLEVRSGYLRFRIQGMDATEYAVSCFFLGNPNSMPNPAVPAFFPRNLLQPLALLDRLKFTADKDPTSAAIHGEVAIEKK
jgi:hypothetical protein